MTDKAAIVEELRFEIARRSNQYPKLVAAGKMTAANAAHRMACLQEAVNIIEAVGIPALDAFGRPTDPPAEDWKG